MISWKPDEESEERLQWRGVVRRNDDERNRSFRQTDENPRMKAKRITQFLGLEGTTVRDAEPDS